jgi:hypothetical protein
MKMEVVDKLPPRKVSGAQYLNHLDEFLKMNVVFVKTDLRREASGVINKITQEKGIPVYAVTRKKIVYLVNKNLIDKKQGDSI